jgi:hypothetical protein
MRAQSYRGTPSIHSSVYERMQRASGALPGAMVHEPGNVRMQRARQQLPLSGSARIIREQRELERHGRQVLVTDAHGAVDGTMDTPAGPVHHPKGPHLGARRQQGRVQRGRGGARHGVAGSLPHGSAHPMGGRPGQPCTSTGCAACPPAWLTARAAPVSGPPRHLRSNPHPQHGLYPAYALELASHVLLMSVPSPVWSFFGPKKTDLVPKMQARPPSQRVAP